MPGTGRHRELIAKHCGNHQSARAALGTQREARHSLRDEAVLQPRYTFLSMSSQPTPETNPAQASDTGENASEEKPQRRETCRIEPLLEVRYRATNTEQWKTAELRDVSLGGTSLMLREELPIGLNVLLELPLNGTLFTLPATVCRLERPEKSEHNICALRYKSLEPRQQDRLSRAITQLQLKLISTRVKVT